MRALCAIIGALLVGSATAARAADEEPICTDRPGKSSGTCTVPTGHWQVETALADWSLQKGGGVRSTSLVLGETTLKYGLTDRSDIQIDVTPWQRQTSRAGAMRDRAAGFGDVTILYKHRLTSDGAALAVAAFPFIKVPTAKRSLGNGKWEGGLLLPIGYSIPNSPLSIASTPELDWLSDADGHGYHAAMAQVVNLSWAVTDKLNLSAEIWGQWDWDPAGTEKQASVDGALAYRLSDDLQLDAGANFGLNRSTPDVELYTGVSVRF